MSLIESCAKQRIKMDDVTKKLVPLGGTPDPRLCVTRQRSPFLLGLEELLNEREALPDSEATRRRCLIHDNTRMRGIA